MVCWPKPFYELESRIYNYLHSKPNCSLSICIQISSRKYHNWNIYLFKIFRLTYPYGNITSRAIDQDSYLPTTGKTTQCTTFLFHYQHTLSLIGVEVPIWTCFTQTLSYKHPLTVWDAQVFIFIGVNFSFILIKTIIFCAPSVAPPDTWCNTSTTCPPDLGLRPWFLPTHIHNPTLRCFIILYSSSSTGVISEYISSDHCYRICVLIIPVLMLSNYFLRGSIYLLWYWLLFFTIAIVVLISALMKAVYDRSLYFILSIPYLAWRANEALCLLMWFTILMPSYMVRNWSYISSYLKPLQIVTWRFRISPIKISWYLHSILFSSCSQRFHLRYQENCVFPPALWHFLWGRFSEKYSALSHIDHSPLWSFDTLRQHH